MVMGPRLFDPFLWFALIAASVIRFARRFFRMRLGVCGASAS